MGLRSWAKKKAKKAKRKAQHAGNAVKKTAKKGTEAVEKTAKDSAKEAESLAKKAEEKIRRETLSIIDDVKKLASTAKKEIEEEKKRTLASIKGQATKAAKAAKVVEDKIEDIPGLAEAAVKKAIEEAASAVSSGVLTKALKVVKVLVPKTFGLKIGPICLEIDGIQDRVVTLEKFAKNKPEGSKGIKELILSLAPTSVGIELGVEISIVVVNINALEVGFSATWETEEFLERFDDLLEEVI